MKGLTKIMRSGVTPLRDARAEALQGSDQDPEGLTVLRDIFAGQAITKEPDRIRHLMRTRAEVVSSWTSAREGFLQVGRALLDLDAHLTPEERETLRRGWSRVFPFGEVVASQLRRVASAVDEGRITTEECPVTYSVAYQLAKLPGPDLKRAHQEGLVRADVTRKEIQRFTRTLPRQPEKPGGRRDPALRIKRLVRRRDALRAELQGVERLLEELQRDPSG